MAASQKVIISCAITGSVHTPTMSEHLPLTPDRIAADAVAATPAACYGAARRRRRFLAAGERATGYDVAGSSEAVARERQVGDSAPRPSPRGLLVARGE